MGDGLTFGERVRRERESLKISQSQLARESGLAPGTIGDIERGRQVGTKKIDRLASALKTTTAYLRDGTRVSTEQRMHMVSSLSLRETQLIDRFREMSEKNKQRIEDFAAGVHVSKKAISQTADEIQTPKRRRAG